MNMAFNIVDPSLKLKTNVLQPSSEHMAKKRDLNIKEMFIHQN